MTSESHAVGEWARGPEDGAAETPSDARTPSDSETSSDAEPSDSERLSETPSEASEAHSMARPKRRRVECKSASARPEIPARRVRSRRRPRAHPPTISTVAELLRAYAAAYVRRRHPCGYEIEVSKRSTTADTAFRFDEFFAVQYVSAVLQSEPWQRLVKGVDVTDDAFLRVSLDGEIGRDVDVLIGEVTADAETRGKHRWVQIFNAVGDDPDAEGRCTVEFRGSARELAVDVLAAVRRAVLVNAFGELRWCCALTANSRRAAPAGSDDHPLKVVGEGALWVASGTGPQEPHLDTVPVKTAAHLAQCGLLPYAVFVAGAEPRTVWIYPADGAPRPSRGSRRR